VEGLCHPAQKILVKKRATVLKIHLAAPGTFAIVVVPVSEAGTAN